MRSFKYANVEVSIPKPSETKGCVIGEGTPKEAGMASNVSEKLEAVLNEWPANTDTPLQWHEFSHGDEVSGTDHWRYLARALQETLV